jgi:hypothetical protein
MSDVYGYKRNPKPRGVFSNEDSKLVFGSTGSVDSGGYLVQQWQVNYRQQVQEMFEIGSNALYWVKGRPQGQGTLQRAIGDIGSSVDRMLFFPAEAYDLCKGGASLTLTAAGGACEGTTATPVSITMDGVAVEDIGFSMTAQDVRLVEAMTWRFAYMAFK